MASQLRKHIFLRLPWLRVLKYILGSEIFGAWDEFLETNPWKFGWKILRVFWSGQVNVSKNCEKMPLLLIWDTAVTIGPSPNGRSIVTNGPLLKTKDFWVMGHHKPSGHRPQLCFIIAFWQTGSFQMAIGKILLTYFALKSILILKRFEPMMAHFFCPEFLYILTCRWRPSSVRHLLNQQILLGV